METIGIQYKIEGGIAKLDGLDMSRLAQFCKDHPGRGGIMSLTVYDGSSSDQQFGYYKAVVIPAWQTIFKDAGSHYSLAKVEETLDVMFLQKMFDADEFDDLDAPSATAYIQRLIIEAADLQHIIPPPHG